MSNLFSILLFVLSVLIYLFFFWRRLREDHASPVIFRAALVMVACFAIGSLVFTAILPRILPTSKIFSPNGLWFWGALTGLAVGFASAAKGFSLPIYETLEASVVGFLFAVPFVTGEWIYSIVAIVAYYFFRAKYKRFHWYKSGKVGFAGLAAMGVFFLVRSLLALVGSRMIVFTGIGKVEVVLCAALAFLSFFAVYNLSEQT